MSHHDVIHAEERKRVLAAAQTVSLKLLEYDCDFTTTRLAGEKGGGMFKDAALIRAEEQVQTQHYLN